MEEFKVGDEINYFAGGISLFPNTLNRTYKIVSLNNNFPYLTASYIQTYKGGIQEERTTPLLKGKCVLLRKKSKKNKMTSIFE